MYHHEVCLGWLLGIVACGGLVLSNSIIIRLMMVVEDGVVPPFLNVCWEDKLELRGFSVTRAVNVEWVKSPFSLCISPTTAPTTKLDVMGIEMPGSH